MLNRARRMKFGIVGCPLPPGERSNQDPSPWMGEVRQ